MIETAYAKINLALHVRRRREDGYHELETLFAFVDAGDGLTARPAERDELTIFGEFAPQLADPFGNIVAQALAKLLRLTGPAGKDHLGALATLLAELQAYPAQAASAAVPCSAVS